MVENKLFVPITTETEFKRVYNMAFENGKRHGAWNELDKLLSIEQTGKGIFIDNQLTKYCKLGMKEIKIKIKESDLDG